MNSNSTQICRLCLETSNGLVNIFETFQDSTVDSVLAKHFWFQINKDDGMPEWVCEICWSQTKTFHHFYKRLELRHENYFNSIVLVDEIKQERGVSPIEAAVEAFLFVEKYEEETGVTIKTDDTQTPSMENSCDEDNDEKSGDQSEAEAEQTSDDVDTSSPDKPKRYISLSPSDIERQDAKIRKYFTMKCEICSDVEFDTLATVRNHYRQVHKTIGYLICCGNKYHKRSLILDHIQYHGNPDAHRCDQCGKSYRNRKILSTHMKCHGSSYKCSLCPKTYISSSMLNYHVREKHSTDMSDKFPCERCDIIFPTRYKLTRHLKTVHGPPINNICEACGRSFKSKNDLKYHIELEHSTTPLPKAQCYICGTWVKHQRYLRHHLKMHQEVQEAQKGKVLNCPICKKKVQSKRLLAVHIRNAHGERKHQCTYCEKAFKTPKNLKEHIALHTGEDLYSCPYCDKSFKSNANMYSHRKKAHLEEWTRDKEEKERIKQIAPSETETTAKAVVDE
ncbi:transcription factor grauzone-like isoform X1 [Bradysia coprophila]|uniref:transcription factor grauzone-like isoform X1 n=1 Tax=Bradysia coprophila TaxID=38358 RepID=UPI00187D93B6|nr:transcription factor grauzone-like isoform X1 [Bradysia coprophila]